MIIASYLRVGAYTTVNIVRYAATRGRHVWLEGRVRGGVFSNWAKRFRYMPPRFVAPRTEEEIVGLVRGASQARVFGSGHSFNDGVVSDDVLVSLDDYSGLVATNRAEKQMTIKAGTRVRDVVKLLAEEGLAFPALPSHDAQSIAGIISTDVHGTGREWGFVSESVVRLKLVDGHGTVHVCEPADDLFRAAIGGVGAVGIITEVTIQGVRRFTVEQRTDLMDIAYVEEHLDSLLAENQHFSLYLFPFTDQCQVNTWNPTDRPPTRGGALREFVNISLDALLAAWVGNLLAYTRLLRLARYWSRLAYFVRRGTNVVLESDEAYNRSIYHLHQELEFTVPFADTFETCRRFMNLYEELYPSGLPYVLFEVRFTPAGHDNTLLGAGRGRRSTWIDLVCNDSDGFETYYKAAEKVLKEIGARPHLGKYCRAVTAADLRRLYGGDFETFQRLVATHDPDSKFANTFTRRLFDTQPTSAPTAS